jgi:hypothetical protein
MKKILFLCLSLITTVQALSQIEQINVGTSANDRTGDPIRTAFVKTNTNLGFHSDIIDTLGYDVDNLNIRIYDAEINLDDVSVRLDSLIDAGPSAVSWGAITGTLSSQTDLQTALNAKVPITRTINSQPLSGDVTLSKSNIGLSNVDNTSDASKPISTATQTALDAKVSTTVTVNGHPLSSNVTVTASDLSLGNVNNTSDANKPVSTATQTALDLKASLTGTETLTNKRITARVQSVSSSATVTPNADSDDAVKVTAQAAGLTLANPSGTPTGMQAMVIRIKDNGTARSISFGNQYRAIGVTLPTTTVISKTMYLGIIWNADDSKWDVIGYSLEN